MNIFLNKINEKHLNLTIKTEGWVLIKRDHGKIIFIDVMFDHKILQCVVKNNKELEDKIKIQDYIEIKGIFRKKNIKQNKNNFSFLAMHELETIEIKVLSKCDSKIPCNINNDFSYLESLKYRHLFLRNDKNLQPILFKEKFIDFARKFMQKQNFKEIHTPLLCAPSPEGARDYIVPSRLQKGKFYALPQSPQQFKQILILSGLEKYFQIAPCFRDEDARSDRYIGEFYQLDFEMVVKSKTKLINFCLKILKVILKQFFPNLKTIVKKLSFLRSMSLYGTDKPNILGYKICRKGIFKILINSNIYNKNTVFNALNKNFLNTFLISNFENLGHTKIFDEKLISQVSNELERNFFAVGVAYEKKFNYKNSVELNNNLSKIIIFLNKNFPLYKQENLVSVAIIKDYPLFIKQENKYVFAHNPFCKVKNFEFNKELKLNKLISHQIDIVINGFEVGSGSLRNNNAKILEDLFKKTGCYEQFKTYIDMFKYGSPEHGGFAFGIERTIMSLTGFKIHEIYAFPFNKNGIDEMLNAPIELQNKDIEYLNIKKI